MDPTNNPTPTPTPTPVSGAGPELNKNMPEISGAGSVSPVSFSEPSVAPVNSATVPAESVNPVTPVNPVTTANPVNPIINPSVPNMSSSTFQPNNGVSATDPIMMPEAPTPPDPIEEELKAPMKAAEPVPGSIGSAVSGPMNGSTNEAPVVNTFGINNTPNVSFNDPAMQQENVMPSNVSSSTTGRSNKTTLIVLIVVAAIIVIVLGVILAMQLFGGQ